MRMAQVEGKLLEVEDSPDGHLKLSAPEYQLAIGNGLELPEEEEDGLGTAAASKNDENDVINRLKQQRSEVEEEEEEYIVLYHRDSNLNLDNTEIVQDEVLKVFSGLDTFGTRDIFKKEVKDSESSEPTGTNGTVDRAPFPVKTATEKDLPGPECASVNGVTQFFDSIHALSIVAAQDLESEASLQSTSVHVSPPKNIQKEEKNRSAGTGLIYSHPTTKPNDLIPTMKTLKNDEHKAHNLNSETAPSGFSPISDESTVKEDENVQLKDNTREPDVPQQECSDIARKQEEEFTGQPPNGADHFEFTVPEKEIMQTPTKFKRSIETPTELDQDPVVRTISEYFYDFGAPDNIQRLDVSQEAESRGQDESGRSDSDEVRPGPCPDNSVIPEETVEPVEEKPDSEEGRGDECAEIASRKQEELEGGEVEEKDKSYDHEKSYTEKIYETASTAAQVVASKLGYGASDGQSDNIDGVKEGIDKGKKGIVGRAGGVVASVLGIKHQEDGQQQESFHDMQEQAEANNVETVEAQFWDAQAEIVETTETQAQ